MKRHIGVEKSNTPGTVAMWEGIHVGDIQYSIWVEHQTCEEKSEDDIRGLETLKVQLRTLNHDVCDIHVIELYNVLCH